MQHGNDGTIPSTTGVIMVLGAPNDDEGRLLDIAQERCAQAWREYQIHPDYRLLPTGGWGEHFNTTIRPHGEYIRRELVQLGVPEALFLPCVESSNTVEDAVLARPILDRCPGAELIVVTSDFHGPRVRFIFEREFPERQIFVSTSATNLERDELALLEAHEARAMKLLTGMGS